MDGSSPTGASRPIWPTCPFYYEYKEKGIGYTDAIKGTYLDNYHQIWDLYINNHLRAGRALHQDRRRRHRRVCGARLCSIRTALGSTRTRARSATTTSACSPFTSAWMGEENQGLCTGSENYWCVNKNASEDDIQATLDFMNWCVTSEVRHQRHGLTRWALSSRSRRQPGSPNPLIGRIATSMWPRQDHVSTGTSPPCLPRSGRTAWAPL